MSPRATPTASTAATAALCFKRSEIRRLTSPHGFDRGGGGVPGEDAVGVAIVVGHRGDADCGTELVVDLATQEEPQLPTCRYGTRDLREESRLAFQDNRPTIG